MDRDLKYKIATYVLSKLEEKGRCVRKDDLEGWAEKEFVQLMPEKDTRAFSLYVMSAFSLLEELCLIKMVSEKSVDLTENGRDATKYNSVEKYIVKQKYKAELNERLDLLNKVIPIVSAICGVISAVVGYKMQMSLILSGGIFLFGISFGVCLYKLCKFFVR